MASALLVLGFAGPARAQCYARSGYLSGSDTCGTQTSGVYYDTNAAFRSYFVSADREYLIATLTNDLGVYDVASPLGPQLLASVHIPWDWNDINVGGSTHEPYINHVMDIATVQGFQYGLVMLGAYGWDVLKLDGKTSKFLGHGYKPPTPLTSSGGEPYLSAAMFRTGDTVYAAAQGLDQPSLAAKDYSIRLYKVAVAGDAGFTEGLTPANIGTGAVVVPIGHAGDPLDNSHFGLGMTGMRLFTLHSASSGKTFLVARSDGVVIAKTVAVVDVSDPNKPVFKSSSSDTGLASSNLAADPDRMMLWAGDARYAKVHGWTVDPQTGALASSVTVDFIAGGPSVGGASVPSVAGNLLAASAAGQIGYVSLAGTPTALPNGGSDYSDPTRVCLNAAYTAACSHVGAFVTNGHQCVCRSLVWDRDIVEVAPACVAAPGTDGGTGADGSATDGAALGDSSQPLDSATGSGDAGAATSEADSGHGGVEPPGATSGCGCGGRGGVPSPWLLVAGLCAVTAAVRRRRGG